MPPQLESTALTILHLMLARSLFIGDEVRVATLRTSWVESGRQAQEFGDALSQLQQLAAVRIAHGSNGPVAQLTKQCMQLGQRKPIATVTTAGVRREQTVAIPARPESIAMAAPQTGSQPAAVSALLTRTNQTPSPSLETQAARSAPRQTQSQAQSPAKTPSQTPTTTTPINDRSSANKLTHAAVFGGSSPSPATLQYCVLGILRNQRLIAGQTFAYAELLKLWHELDLRQDDLLLAIQRLSETGHLTTISYPSEQVMLSAEGYAHYEHAPSDMADGQHRWDAKKHLRLIKRLGALRAAS